MKRINPARFVLHLLCSLWLPLPLPAFAQGTQTQLHKAVEDYLRVQTQGLPGRVSYRITPLDARTQLSPCDAFEPFLPSGSAPWGRTTIGVHCQGPSTWTVYIQVQISVFAKYLVAARPLAAGQIVGPNDFVSRSGDLGLLPATILMDAEQALGKTVKIGIAAGQPLRGDQLIAPWAVQQGQNVKTISRGAGFSVSSEGKALNNAAEGQMVQVRTPSGQTVTGVARAGGIVEVNY